MKQTKSYPGKVMTVGLTMDERIADGLYYANTLRYFTTLMSRPEMLLKKDRAKVYQRACQRASRQTHGGKQAVYARNQGAAQKRKERAKKPRKNTNKEWSV